MESRASRLDWWPQVERLFHEATALPPDQREAFLCRACEDDAMQREVESLLAQQSAAQGFLSHPAAPESSHDPPLHRVPLPPGYVSGPYRIEALVGAGGMGEVYRAHDTVLGRDVAIKVLPPVWLADADRRARFEREARLLASLNHPNIAAIYGLAQHDDVQGLVLELVDGPTLAERLEGGPLPVEESLVAAIQIAEALEATHERGIIHRDLKPANIALRPDPLASARSVVKVLDFGIAQAIAGEHAPPAAERTRAGAVLGTAAYMSPEQTRGRPVDRKTDIWAFGCVLYEMLCGQQPFLRATASDTTVAVLEHEPDWSRLPPVTPERIRGLLHRCLRKEPRSRLHDIADARIELEEALSTLRTGAIEAPDRRSTLDGSRSGRRRAMGLLAGTAALLTAVLWAGIEWRRPGSPSPKVVPLAVKPGDESYASISPNGKEVAFQWKTPDPSAEGIYVLLIGDESPTRVTSGGSADLYPVWAPDGDRIAFIRREAGHDGIYQVSKFGGAEKKIAELGAMDLPALIDCFYNPVLAWSPDGRWIAVGAHRVSADAGIVLVNVADGTTRPLSTHSTAARHYSSLSFSHSGDALAYAGCTDINSHQCRVGVAELDSAYAVTHQRWLTTELEVVNGTTWAPDGQSVIYGAASVWLNTFHLWRAPRVGGRPPERLDVAGTATLPTVSARSGRLVYSRRPSDLGIWSVHAGEPLRRLAPSTFSEYEASFAPDRARIAFVTDRAGEGSEVWTADAAGGKLKRLTPGLLRTAGSPRWSPDGQWLAYDGKAEDGLWHVFTIEAAGGASHRVVPGHVGENLPSWSHDGKWVYFVSNRDGSRDIWKAPSSGGPPEKVTRGGASAPLESPDGLTLYFTRAAPSGGNTLLSMPSTGGAETVLLNSVEGWAYWPTERGVYFALKTGTLGSRQRYEIRLLDPKTGRTTLFNTVTMAYFHRGMSAIDDTVLIGGIESIDVDLMMIEHFK